VYPILAPLASVSRAVQQLSIDRQRGFDLMLQQEFPGQMDILVPGGENLMGTLRKGIQIVCLYQPFWKRGMQRLAGSAAIECHHGAATGQGFGYGASERLFLAGQVTGQCGQGVEVVNIGAVTASWPFQRDSRPGISSRRLPANCG